MVLIVVCGRFFMDFSGFDSGLDSGFSWVLVVLMIQAKPSLNSLRRVKRFLTDSGKGQAR